NMMVRWICGKTLKSKISSEEWRKRLGIESIQDVVRQGRLRWYGHVERKSDEYWVKKCLNLGVDGKVGRGRSRKTWSECVKRDMKLFGLKVEDTKDRLLWRRKIFGTMSEPCKHGKNRR